MNDVILNIKLNFEKETLSREAFKTLKAALSDYDDDLSKSLDTVKGLSKEEVDTEIIVLDVGRKRKVISTVIVIRFIINFLIIVVVVFRIIGLTIKQSNVIPTQFAHDLGPICKILYTYPTSIEKLQWSLE